MCVCGLMTYANIVYWTEKQNSSCVVYNTKGVLNEIMEWELEQEIWGLFDRASSTWNNFKCQLDITRWFYYCVWCRERHHPHRTHDLRSVFQGHHPSRISVQKFICCSSKSNAPVDGRMYPKLVELKIHQWNDLFTWSWHLKLFHVEDARSNNPQISCSNSHSIISFRTPLVWYTTHELFCFSVP